MAWRIPRFFAETVFTKVSQRGAIDDMLEESLETLTKSSLFKEAFTDETLTSSLFVRLVAKFICSKIETKTHLANNIGKNQEPLPFSNNFPFHVGLVDRSQNTQTCYKRDQEDGLAA